MEILEKQINKIIKRLKESEERILAGKEPRFFHNKKKGEVPKEVVLFWCNILENRLKEEKGNEGVIKAIGLIRTETLKGYEQKVV